jgi:uncharacterized protein YbjT (DUF2867 family)
MILITGSAGKTGRSVLQALVARGIPVRALVHRTDQVPDIQALGSEQVLVGDMRAEEVMHKAVQDIQVLYHIPPNMSPAELEIGRIVIDAAESSGVEHFVYHSVLKPQIQAMPHHWNKMLVEEQLVQSGLPYTILQPAAYMQNILAHWDTILNKGVFPVPYPADARLSLVDLSDVAQAAAIVLTEAGHKFATYELVGTSSLSQTDVADILSEQLDRPVKVSSVPLDQWAAQARAAGLGEYQVATLVKMFEYYQNTGFEGNTKVLSWLLGRPPVSLQDFIHRSMQEKQQLNQISVN